MESHETCGRCGRKLKTLKSKESGYGPVCLKKIEEEKQQTTIDDFGAWEGDSE